MFLFGFLIVIGFFNNLISQIHSVFISFLFLLFKYLIHKYSITYDNKYSITYDKNLKEIFHLLYVLCCIDMLIANLMLLACFFETNSFFYLIIIQINIQFYIESINKNIILIKIKHDMGR